MLELVRLPLLKHFVRDARMPEGLTVSEVRSPFLMHPLGDVKA